MYTTPPIYDAPPIYGWIDQYLSYPGAVDLCDIASDKETWKAISKHLLSHKGLQSKNYSSYPEFLNAVANRDVTVNQQKKAIHTESTDILSHFREINELLIHSNQKRDIFPFPTDNSTVYQSFKDVVTEKIVSSWEPQEKVFLSADSTKETLDTLIQYFSAYDPSQRIVIFSGRKYRTPSEITGSDSLDKFLNSESNIMVIPYDVAAAKCRNRDQAFFFFCGQSRYLFFLDAACILNDSWDDNSYYLRTGSLTETLDDWKIDDIPNSWDVCCLGEVCDYGNCTNVDTKDIPETAWILDLEDIEKDTGKILQKLTLKERNSASTKHLFHKGQILYSKLRPYLNKVVLADDDGFCTSEILPLNFNGYILPEYAKCYMMSPTFLRYANHCSYGVKMPRLGTLDGKKAVLTMPPINEQKRIADKVSQLFSLLDSIAENIN